MSKRMFMTVFVCLALAAAFAIAGCGSDSNDTATKTEDGNVAAANANGNGGASQRTSTSEVIDQDKGGPTAGGTTPGNQSGEEPPPIQVLLGGESGFKVDEPTVVIVHNQKDYKALMKKHFSDGVPRTDIAGTQFPERQIVAVFFPKAPKGTGAQVTAVNEIDGQIVVKVLRVIPAKGCTKGGTAPHPFSIVDTRGMDSSKTPKLVVVDQKNKTCI